MRDSSKAMVLRLLVLLAIIIAIIAVYRLNPAIIEFRKYSAADFTQQLMPLVLIAFFIERSLEIFITVWRGGEAASLQAAVEAAKGLLEGDSSKKEAVKTAEKNLADYRFDTQKIALPLGLVFGILIASLGVRGLGNFALLDKLTGDRQKCSLISLMLC